MIYILDSKDKVLGVLDNRTAAACPFYNDVRTHKIADDSGKIWSETLTLEVPYGYEETDLLDENTQLLMEDDNGKWKLFTIYDVTDSISGETHTKKVESINSCIWKMNHTFLEEKSWTGANSNDIFNYIFQRSGWLLDDFNDFFNGGLKSYSISEGNAQNALDTATKDFNVEIDAYVKIKNGSVIEKRVFLTDKLGEKTGERFEYRNNLNGASRKKSNLDFYTKLFVFGGQNSKGTRATITSVNKQLVPGTTNTFEYQPFLLDDEANEKYNDGLPYLEGYVVNESIVNPNGLLTWGKEQLKIYNHPKYTYTVDVDLLENYLKIGDTVAVVDFEMSPKLTITARVIETNNSVYDTKNNSVVLGEFVTINTVTPNDIVRLQNLAEQALQNATDAVDWKIELFTQDGLDFGDEVEKKRIVAKVWKGKEDVTNLLLRSSFVWEKYDEYGNKDPYFTEAHKTSGHYIEIGVEDSDSTIRCSIKSDVSGEPIFYAEEKDLNFFSRLKLSDTYPELNAGVQQYCHYDFERNTVYWTKVNKTLVTEAEREKAESFVIIRATTDGTILDYMLIKFGGHGSHFGFEYKNGKPYFITPMTDTAGTKNVVYSCEFPYQAGKTITITDTSVTKIRQYTARLNYDAKNNYILAALGKAEATTFRIYDKTNFYSKQALKTLYEFKAEIFGIRSNQVYQSSCLDFPYLYVNFGQTYIEGCETYCIDVRNASIVYKIIYLFDKGNINFYHNHAETETINFYFDETGEKHLIMGFVLRNPNEKINTRQNELYVFTETEREETFIDDDLNIDDELIDEE